MRRPSTDVATWRGLASIDCFKGIKGVVLPSARGFSGSHYCVARSMACQASTRPRAGPVCGASGPVPAGRAGLCGGSSWVRRSSMLGAEAIDRESVHPTGPVRSVGLAARRPNPPKRESTCAARVASGIRMAEKLGEAVGHGCIVLICILGCGGLGQGTPELRRNTATATTRHAVPRHGGCSGGDGHVLRA